jgi:hypothetical protein
MALPLKEIIMPNEHIEEFKRFAAAYLRWIDFSFARIVSDVLKKHGVQHEVKSQYARHD